MLSLLEEVYSQEIDRAGDRSEVKIPRSGSGRNTYRTSGRTSYGRSRRSAASPVVKVLTSATFIRGVLGILKKVM